MYHSTNNYDFTLFVLVLYFVKKFIFQVFNCTIFLKYGALIYATLEIGEENGYSCSVQCFEDFGSIRNYWIWYFSHESFIFIYFCVQLLDFLSFWLSKFFVFWYNKLCPKMKCNSHFGFSIFWHLQLTILAPKFLFCARKCLWIT